MERKGALPAMSVTCLRPTVSSYLSIVCVAGQRPEGRNGGDGGARLKEQRGAPTSSAVSESRRERNIERLRLSSG
eukprot:3620654-Rhodomonas_salina.1